MCIKNYKSSGETPHRSTIMDVKIPSFNETEASYKQLQEHIRGVRYQKQRHIKMAAYLRIADELIVEASQPLTPTQFEEQVQAEIRRIRDPKVKPHKA